MRVGLPPELARKRSGRRNSTIAALALVLSAGGMFALTELGGRGSGTSNDFTAAGHNTSFSVSVSASPTSPGLRRIVGYWKGHLAGPLNSVAVTFAQTSAGGNGTARVVYTLPGGQTTCQVDYRTDDLGNGDVSLFGGKVADLRNGTCANTDSDASVRIGQSGELTYSTHVSGKSADGQLTRSNGLS
ncbi:hypothetical protein [Kitasatospora sp. NPDC056531]|uniref:hypothetical protein n=1 Tax=Kitasatospora sp. NPDC056531 TaxID=3345856 RepID=UPI00367E7237